jgi:uncharacterized protein (TIGR00251 family)
VKVRMARLHQNEGGPIEPTGDGVRLQIRVVPRASRTEVVGVQKNAIRIRLKAAPVDGAGNQELLRYLAEALQVPRAQVHLGAGDKGRRKLILVSGTTVERVRANLGLPVGHS